MVDTLVEHTYITIKPCYSIYTDEQHTSLWRLHQLWDEYIESKYSNMMQNSVQSWHYIRALQSIFRERNEWDDQRARPVKHTNSMPTWKKLGLKPGTPAWLKHWKAYPDEQHGMSLHTQRVEGRK